MLKKRLAPAFGAAFCPLGKPLLRAALMVCASLLCGALVFWCVQPSGLALTLERPDVKVDWSKLPDKKKNEPKLVYAPNRLFGTVEFRSTIKNMPQWDRVLNKYAKRTSLDADFSGAQRAEWTKLVDSASRMKPLEKVQTINKFFNRWPYRTDIDLYGLVDFWATPAEFIKNSGDCEDYSITKMFGLIQLGIDPAKMRVVLIKDTIRNIDHAILAVYLDEEVYILDNVSPMVLPHSKYGHYKPILSFNLSHRWAHVPPSK